jgi:hypothetical protein
LKITEEHLKTWHESIDQTYIVKCNRAVLKSLHNDFYPTGKANTKANQKLQHIVDTTEILKIISGENTGDEGEWKSSLWKIPCVQVWSKLLFNFEELTDMINGAFVNDLVILLHDVTTSGKTQTLYDVDVKIATMGLTICKNFKEVPVFWDFFHGSVRQSMIQNLESNAETHLQREDTTSDKHTAVLKVDTSDSKEILALRAELVDLKTSQLTVTTTQGGGNHRFDSKRRRDGGARTANKTPVDT